MKGKLGECPFEISVVTRTRAEDAARLTPTLLNSWCSPLSASVAASDGAEYHFVR